MKKKRLMKWAFVSVFAVLGLWPLALEGAEGADATNQSYIRVKTRSAILSIVDGEVAVTYETGETKTYKAGDDIPPLPDGAVLTVVSGNAKLKADNSIVSLSEGDSVLLFVDSSYRPTRVQPPSDYLGELVVQTGGTRQTLKAGDTYWAPTRTTKPPKDKDDTATTDGDDDDKGDDDDYVDTTPTGDGEDTPEDRLPNTPSDEDDTEPPSSPPQKPASDSGE